MGNILNIEDFLIPEIKRTKGLFWRYNNGVYSTKEIIITTKDGIDICMVTCSDPYYIVNWYNKRALSDKNITLKYNYAYATELIYHVYLVAEYYMKKEKTEMANKDSSISLMVSGKNIIYKNFSGSHRAYNPIGDRNFALIVGSKTLKDALEAKGCTIKKIVDSDREFVKIKVPKAMEIRSNNCQSYDLFKLLDKTKIISADLELIFHKVFVNGKEYTPIYLRNAKFRIESGIELSMRLNWPNNKTEDNTMKNEEYMSRDETILTLGVLLYAYRTHKGNFPDDDMTKNLFKAIDSAHHYMSEDKNIANTNKAKTKTCNADKPMITGYELEKAGDFAAIKQVIFNDPATIVVWWDDTKTVVKCQEGDVYDKEKGLAMAICKRLYGNESNYNNVINKWVHPKNKVKKSVKKETPKKTKKTRKSKRAMDVAINGLKTNTTMVVLSDAYITKLRVKMAERGMNYIQLAEKSGLGKSTVGRLVSTKSQKYIPARIRRSVFDKLNAALGIRWKEQ